MAKTPAAKLKSQFDSYEQMINTIVSSITSLEGAPQMFSSVANKLCNRLLQENMGVLPHKLAVDSLYLTCNALGVPIGAKRMGRLCKKLFQVNTRPEVHKWIHREGKIDIVCEILKCEPSDLPMRGASGETMEGINASTTDSE